MRRWGRFAGRTAKAGLILAILFVSRSPATAQDRRKGTWEIGLYTGLHQFGLGPEFTLPGIPPDTIEIETDFFLGTRAGYNLTEHIQVEVAWDYITTQLKDPFDFVSIDSVTGEVNAIYNIRSNIENGIDPYLLLGIGFIQQEYEVPRLLTPDPDDSPDNYLIETGFNVKNSDTVFTAGLGMRIYGTEKFGFRFEFKQKRFDMLFPPVREITDTVFDEGVLDYEFSFGVLWRIGKGGVEVETEEIPLD